MAREADVTLHSDGTIDGLCAAMQKNGITHSVTLPVATKASQVNSINRYALANRREGIITFGAIHHDYSDLDGEFRFLKENGFPGIKLHPDYQDFYPNERRLYPVYERAEALGLIIAFHTGDDIGHPRPGHSLPRLFAPVMKDFPRLTIIAAHFGGFMMWEQAFEFFAGKNVYIDTSFTFDYIETDRLMRILKKHDSNRILMGSDSPWGSVAREIAWIRDSGMPADNKDRILGGNAAKLFGLGG